MALSRPKTPGSMSEYQDNEPSVFNVEQDDLDGDKYVLVALDQSDSLPVHWPKREAPKPAAGGRGKDAAAGGKKKKKVVGKAGDFFKPDVSQIPFTLPDHFSPASSDKVLQAAIDNYAARLGVDPEKEPQLMWMVEECFKSPLPEGWKVVHIPNGTHLYVHRSGTAVDDNPVTLGYKKMLDEMRFKAAQAVQRIMRGYLLRHRLARYMEGRDRRHMDTHALIHAVSRVAPDPGPSFVELSRESQWKLLVATSNSLESFLTRADAVDQLHKLREELAQSDAQADEERKEALKAEFAAKSALLGEDIAQADVDALKAKFAREPPTGMGVGAQAKKLTDVDEPAALHRRKSNQSVASAKSGAAKPATAPAPAAKGSAGKGPRKPSTTKAAALEPEPEISQGQADAARRALMGDVSNINDVETERDPEEPEDYLLKHGYDAYWTYANYLLQNRPEASGLMWMVEKAFKTPLPRGWQVVHLFNMTPIFYHKESGRMSATNPIDEHYRTILDNIQFKAAQRIQARIRGCLVRGRHRQYVATSTARFMVDRVFKVSEKFIIADKKHFENRFHHLRTRAFNRRHAKKMAIKIQRTAKRWMFSRQLRKKLDRTEWYVKKLEGMLKNEQEEFIKMHKKLKGELEDAQKAAKMSEEELKERIRESRKVSREKALLKQQFNKYVAEFEEEAQVLRVQYSSMKQLADERLNRMRAIEGDTIQELLGKMGRRESGILKYRETLKDHDDSQMTTDVGDKVGDDEDNMPLGVDNYKGQGIIAPDDTVQSGIIVNSKESHTEGYPTSVVAPSVSPNNNENYMKFLSEYLPPDNSTPEDRRGPGGYMQHNTSAPGAANITGSYGKSFGRYIPPSDPYFESKYNDDGTPKNPEQEMLFTSPKGGRLRKGRKKGSGSPNKLSTSMPSLDPYKSAPAGDDWRPKTVMQGRSRVEVDRSGVQTQGGKRRVKEFDAGASPYHSENNSLPLQHRQYLEGVQRSMTKLGMDRKHQSGVLPQIQTGPPAPQSRAATGDDSRFEISVVRERKKTEYEMLFGDMQPDE